ncbi:hypothetical protein KKC22_09685, partial [Myxococcota bacterium]|nr:hypothetical protein [Myxococcota bacterium]
MDASQSPKHWADARQIPCRWVSSGTPSVGATETKGLVKWVLFTILLTAITGLLSTLSSISAPHETMSMVKIPEIGEGEHQNSATTGPAVQIELFNFKDQPRGPSTGAPQPGQELYNYSMLMAAIRDIQYICSAVVFLKSEPEKVYMAFAYIANLGNTVASFGLPIAKANLQPLLLDTVRVALENNPSLELGQIKEIWEVERKSTLPMKSIHDVTVATKAMLQVMLQDAKNQEVFSPGKTVSVDESVENAAACLFALLDIVRYDNQVLFREKWSSSPFQVLPAGSGRKDLAAFKAVCQVYMKFKDSDSGKSKPWIANLEGPLSRHIRDRAPEVTYIGPPAWLGGNVQLVSSDTVVITELMISRVT